MRSSVKFELGFGVAALVFAAADAPPDTLVEACGDFPDLRVSPLARCV